MHASRPADEDRLPWLEPYRETIAQKQRVARRSHGGLVAIATALFLVPMGIGVGYWLGQGGNAPVTQRSTETVSLPAPRPQPVEVAPAPPTEPGRAVAEAPPAEVVPAPAKVTKPARKKAAARKRQRPKKIRTAGVETDRINAVRSSQERQALAPRPAPTVVWPRMPSPGPAGQVIQLGAFSTPARASNAYNQRIARYPLLGRMPRVIVPVITKPGGRVLYVLRLGTTSRQQSKVVCRNLRRSGDHCLVIG